MNRKIIIPFILLVGVISAVNLTRIPTSKVSKLTLENLNAVAYSEDFMWDGTEWNTTTDYWLGTNWKPVLVDCTVTEVYPFGSETYTGKKVTCNYGKGNCFIGSRCTNS